MERLQATLVHLTHCHVGERQDLPGGAQAGRVETDKDARSVGGSHSVRIPAPTTTGADRRWPWRNTFIHSARVSGSPAPLRVARSPVVSLVATRRWPPAAALPVWTFCSAQYLGETATLVPSRWSFARRLILGTGELM